LSSEQIHKFIEDTVAEIVPAEMRNPAQLTKIFPSFAQLLANLNFLQNVQLKHENDKREEKTIVTPVPWELTDAITGGFALAKLLSRLDKNSLLAQRIVVRDGGRICCADNLFML